MLTNYFEFRLLECFEKKEEIFYKSKPSRKRRENSKFINITYMMNTLWKISCLITCKSKKISNSTSKRFLALDASHSSYSLSVMKLNFSTRANQRRAADDISQYCHKIEPSIKVIMGWNNAWSTTLLHFPSLGARYMLHSGTS